MKLRRCGIEFKLLRNLLLLLRLLSRPVRVSVKGVVLKLQLQGVRTESEALAIAAFTRLSEVVDELNERLAKKAADSKATGFGSSLLLRLARRIVQACAVGAHAESLVAAACCCRRAEPVCRC